MNPLPYLARLQYTAQPAVNLSTLRELQAAHLLRVPFENLDIHLGRRIELAGSYAKIVGQGRGGFCYELNGAFAELLRALGFTVRLISARVHTSAGEFGPEFDHMACLVTLPGTDYLVDVGFGEFSLGPLALTLDVEQEDPRGQFRLRRHDAHYLVVEKFDGRRFQPEYLFQETPREVAEFAAMCHFHQTSPESHFTRKRLCTRPTLTGRVTITGHTLRIKDGANLTETELVDPAEFDRALYQYFEIRL
ncbi:arylamine N-acetyltransferase family protein [Hymenobacter chitinivorans]|uniref:N-hydroxyarylamine O-acetyltransferase n=1 Tax=Hymenobacter chitinivorans DSM 11115 TaxID=1121954 RepID=A0A2M9AR27_9BACT|nr:arylamine N-acetyltransferase [Hymenobacter chitinivorans]PJJ48093.1 N-hydroxyarylamine O-acetyltransferase [Hymenobacter chitinivorans DSM 11115]